MKKGIYRLSSLLVACCMLLTMLPVSARAAEEWDGSASDTTWYTDTSTEFTISDAADLAGLAQLVNGATRSAARPSI